MGATGESKQAEKARETVDEEVEVLEDTKDRQV